MTNPPDAEDAFLGALSPRERTLLAAWADDGDVPDALEDRVVVALLAERLGDREGDAGGVEAEVARSRAATREGRVVRLVGWAAAIAAAAAVLLMVRVLPRASEVEQAREVAAAERAVPAEPPAALRAEAELETPELETPGLETPELEPETACETFDALAAEATLVAARYCSPCHDSADRDAHPGALGVFDVQEQEWWSLMSDAQLEGSRRRAQMLVEDSGATEDEQRKLAAFLARRLELEPHAG